MRDVVAGWDCTGCILSFTPDEHGSIGAQAHALRTAHNVIAVWAEGDKSDSLSDPVNSPSHYTSGKIEVIDFIEDQGLGFHEGNVVKYVARAGKKDPDKHIQDLEKARWYLDRRIKNLKEASE